MARSTVKIKGKIYPKDKSEMISFLVANYRLSLNPKSKWFNQDLQEFKAGLSRLKEKEIILRYNNAIAFNSVSFQKQIDKEEAKMMRAGLYNIGNMKPENCLD